MALSREHELHKRRFSRNMGLGLALIGLVVALYALMWILDACRSRILLRLAARLQSRLDAPAFTAALRASSGAGQNAPRHLENVQTFFASPAVTAIMDAPFTPVFLAAIFIFHTHLGLLALGGGIGLILVTIVGQWSVRANVARARHHQEAAQSYADAIAKTGEYVQAQGLTDNVLPIWQAERTQALRASLGAQDRSTGTSTLTKSLRLALQSLMLALGAWLVLRGELTAGAMIAASILLGRALAPVEQLLSRWTQCIQARQSWLLLSAMIAKLPTAAPRTKLPRPFGISVKGATVSAKPGACSRMSMTGSCLISSRWAKPWGAASYPSRRCSRGRCCRG